MTQEQLSTIIKLVLDRNFEEKEQGYYDGFKSECDDKEKLYKDLIETLIVFLKE